MVISKDNLVVVRRIKIIIVIKMEINILKVNKIRSMY
jgi:hypothetical protein